MNKITTILFHIIPVLVAGAACIFAKEAADELKEAAAQTIFEDYRLQLRNIKAAEPYIKEETLIKIFAEIDKRPRIYASVIRDDKVLTERTVTISAPLNPLDHFPIDSYKWKTMGEDVTLLHNDNGNIEPYRVIYETFGDKVAFIGVGKEVSYVPVATWIYWAGGSLLVLLICHAYTSVAVGYRRVRK